MEGTRQGGGESSFTFAKGLEDINGKLDEDGVRYVQIVDDIFAIIEPTQENIDELTYTMQKLEVVLSTHGLKMNVGKTQILCPRDVVLPPEVADLRLPLHLRGATPKQEPPNTDVCLGAVLQCPAVLWRRLSRL